MRDIEEAYRRCLVKERDRERKHRKTAKATTDANALHYDAEQEEDEDETLDFGFDVSDNGTGAEAIYDAVDASCFGCGNHYTRSRRRALAIVRRKAPSASPTLKAILRNESNRRESIWELANDVKRLKGWVAAEKKYYRDRALLLKLFRADAVAVR